MGPTCVPKCFSNGEICVREFGVLAHNCNLNGWLLGNDLRNKLLPLGEIGNGGADSEFAGQKVAKAKSLKLQRYFIDGSRGGGGDDCLYGYVRKERNLLAHVIWDRVIGAEDDHVRLNAAAAQLLHRVLRWLCLQLTSCCKLWEEGDVNVERISATNVLLELTNRFDEGQRLDVTHRSPNFNDYDIDIIASEPKDSLLDLVGDVRDHLHGATEIVAAALSCDHGGVDATGRDVRRLGEVHINEAFVVTKVEIRLCAVIGDVDLAVLVRRHGAWVDVEIRIELDDGDAQATRFKEEANRCGGDPLAEGGGDATGDEHKLRRHLVPSASSVWAGRSVTTERA